MSISSPDSKEEDALTRQALSEQDSRFDRWRKVAGAIAAPLGFLATWLLTSGNLPPAGQNLAAVLAAVGVLWVTETLPLPVTAILGAAAAIVLGVADAKTVLAPFADPIVFLFIGSFILARSMTLHRLDRRMALAFLLLPCIGGHPGRVLAGLGVVTALVSMWVSNTATAAMMFPVSLGILQALDEINGSPNASRLRDWPYATGLMLMVAFAASVGGLGTPVGSPPNLIALGLIRSLAGVPISFFRWMALALPLVAAMGTILFVLMVRLHPAGPMSRETAGVLRQYLARQYEGLGGWTVGQINTLAAFAVAVFLWTLPGVLSLALPREHPWLRLCESRLPEAVAAIVAAGLLFILPTNLRQRRATLSWEEAVRIDWGVILLFGGGLSLGSLMFKTGVAEALGHAVTAWTGSGSLWSLTAVAIAMGIVLSETTSNTAAASMVVPVVIAIAQSGNVDPVPPALGACFGASFGFMLPVSTPPNAIVYSSGLVPIWRMIRAGVLFDILGFAVILLGLRLLCPWLGLAR
ncbi:MAG: DASS family sodium-coupled anion symporter [Pirellulales bacterium]|nr:DASS family sodium-coupled anion symporter [Pirellulales bacterium]